MIGKKSDIPTSSESSSDAECEHMDAEMQEILMQKDDPTDLLGNLEIADGYDLNLSKNIK